MRCSAAIRDRPFDFVGQEVVRLSTTPAWRDGRLTPSPFVLRVYAAATKDGWRVMPGGFCRTSDRADARAISMGEGAEAADVWVISDQPVERVSLLAGREDVKVRRIPGHLPSRAADNLYLAGPLPRTGRGDGAAGAQPVHEPDGVRGGAAQRRRDPGPAQGPAVRLGRDPQGRPGRPGLDGRRQHPARRAGGRFGHRPGAGGAARGGQHPRAAVGRLLETAGRPRKPPGGQRADAGDRDQRP